MKKLLLLIAFVVSMFDGISQGIDNAAVHRIGDYGKLWVC